MKRLFIGLASIFIGLLSFSLVMPALSASAADVFTECQSPAFQKANTEICQTVGKQGSDTSLNNNPILKVIKTIIDVLSYIIGVAAVIVLIVAGLQMIIGGDNPQTVETARNMVIYALVGIVVAVLAQTVVIFVLKNVP